MRYIIAMIILLCLFSAADIYLNIIYEVSPAVEENPISRFVMERTGVKLFFAIKIFNLFLICTFLLIYFRFYPTQTYIISTVLNIYYAACFWYMLS